MRVLVTGGAGFIGANLCRSLLADGHDVRALDDLSTGRVGNLDGLSLDLVEGSIVEPAVVAGAAADVDRIVHLAARASVPRSIAEPFAAHEANVTGTVNVLEAARPRGLPVIVASSSSVYGDTAVSPKLEDLPVAPRSPYAASKLATEGYALAYGVAYALPVLALRFFNVYGPLQPADHAYAAVVPRFIDAALAGRPVEIHGDGVHQRLEGDDRRIVSERVVGPRLQMLDHGQQRVRDLSDLLAVTGDIRQHVLLDIWRRGLPHRDVDETELAAGGTEERRINGLDDIPRQGQLEHRHAISPR